MPIIETDFLSAGEHAVGGEINYIDSSWDGYIDQSVDGNMKITLNIKEFPLQYAYGITDKQMLLMEIPYVFSSDTDNTVDWDDGSRTEFQSSENGLGDLAIQYRLMVYDSAKYRVSARLGVKIPVGDDDSGDPEIIEDGVKTQSLKKGGAGNGRTDYNAGLSFSFSTGKITLFSSMNYTMNGTKTEEGEKDEPGDDLNVEFGLLHEINEKSIFGVKALYSYFREGKDGDSDVSSSSGYGLIARYMYFVDKNLMLFPQVGFLKIAEIKYTDRTDGSTLKFSELKSLALGVGFVKTF